MFMDDIEFIVFGVRLNDDVNKMFILDFECVVKEGGYNLLEMLYLCFWYGCLCSLKDFYMFVFL